MKNKNWKTYSLRTPFTSQNKSKSENLDRLSNKTLEFPEGKKKKRRNLLGSHRDTRPSRLNRAVSDKLITQCRYVRLYIYICGRSTNRLTPLTVHCTCKYGERTRETFNVDCLHTTCTYAAQVLGRTLISRKYNFSRDRLRFYFHVLACLSQSTVTCKMRLYM